MLQMYSIIEKHCRLFGKELYIRFTVRAIRKLYQFVRVLLSLLVLRMGCEI